MTLEEALEWLKGNRSMTNLMMDLENGNDRQVTLVLIAKIDASMSEQAYWIVRAYKEGLVENILVESKF